MILKGADPDPDVVELVRRELARLREMPRLKLGGLDPDTAALTAPHHVYVLRLDEMLRTKDPVAALRHTRRPVATRFLVRDDTEVVAAVEVGDATGSGLTVNQGPYVKGTVTAIELAEQRDEPPAAEMRLLRVPAVHLTALWLSVPDDADLVVPLRPAPFPLVANTFSTPLQLAETLLSLAVSRFETGGLAGVLGSIESPTAEDPENDIPEPGIVLEPGVPTRHDADVGG